MYIDLVLMSINKYCLYSRLVASLESLRNDYINWFSRAYFTFNRFQTNIFLYPLKTPENLWFFTFSRSIAIEHGLKWINESLVTNGFKQKCYFSGGGGSNEEQLREVKPNHWDCSLISNCVLSTRPSTERKTVLETVLKVAVWKIRNVFDETFVL